MEMVIFKLLANCSSFDLNTFNAQWDPVLYDLVKYCSERTGNENHMSPTPLHTKFLFCFRISNIQIINILFVPKFLYFVHLLKFNTTCWYPYFYFKSIFDPNFTSNCYLR